MKKIFYVTCKNVHWYEAEDENRDRYVITQITHGTPSQGVVDCKDGQGGRYVEWQ